MFENDKQRKIPVVIQWRSKKLQPKLTDQEQQFGEWLQQQKIPYAYEELELVKLLKDKKRKRLLRRRPDFVFHNFGEMHNAERTELLLIELTERKRPSKTLINRKKHDPKRLTRHLARLASIPCAVIYRSELDQFINLFSSLKQHSQFTSSWQLLMSTVIEWNQHEW